MFWGLELKAGQTEKVTPAQNLHLSNAAIAAGAKGDNQKVALLVTVGDQKHTICTLVSGKTDQAALDIILTADVECSFTAQGSAPVSLLGYYVPEGMAMDDEDMSDEEGESDDEEGGIMRPPMGGKGQPISKAMLAKLMAGKGGDSEGDSDDDDGDMMDDGSEGDDEDDDEDDEDEPAPPKGAKPGDKRPQEAKKPQQQQPEKKQKVEQGQKPQTPGKDQGKGQQQQKPQTPAGQKGQQPPQKPQTPAGQQQQKPQTPGNKQQQQKPGTPANAGQAGKPASPGSGQKPQGGPVKHPSGLSFEDVKPGTGKKPQPGKKVTVHYTGRLPNGKIFDSSLGKSPFSFRLGIGEVIKGWDIGVSSMQVGGKRKLVIPANLAYGPRGAPPDIPPNATLHFDVELLDAK